VSVSYSIQLTVNLSGLSNRTVQIWVLTSVRGVLHMHGSCGRLRLSRRLNVDVNLISGSWHCV
jgi:hypothetical protein